MSSMRDSRTPSPSIRVSSRNAAATAAAPTNTNTAAATTVSAVNTFLGARSQEIRKDSKAATPHLQPFEAKHSKYGLTPYVSGSNRPKSPSWWIFYHKYKDQGYVQELAADKVYACCNLCGTNISCGRIIGTGGLAKHIKSMHKGQLRYMPGTQGGSLDHADIDSTIKKRKVRDGDLATMRTSMAERNISFQQQKTTLVVVASVEQEREKTKELAAKETSLKFEIDSLKQKVGRSERLCHSFTKSRDCETTMLSKLWRIRAMRPSWRTSSPWPDP
jgi:hypothetical protein